MGTRGLQQKELEIEEVRPYEVSTLDEVETIYMTERLAREYAFIKCYTQRPTGGVSLFEEGGDVLVQHIDPIKMADADSKPVLSKVQQAAVDHISAYGPATAAGVLGVCRMYIDEALNTSSVLGEMRELTYERTGAPLRCKALDDGTELFYIDGQVV